MKAYMKIINLVIAIALLCAVIVIPQSTAGADYTTMRDISAFNLVSEMNAGISIGNSLDSVGANETSWGNPVITKELIKKYKEVGFNTIRLPVTWRTHIDSNGHPNASWLNRVQEVVDLIINEGLYCILNTHHEQNWLNTNSSGMAARTTKFKNLWTDIGNRFRGYGDHLLFEGFNEILKAENDWSGAYTEDYENANTLSQAFVDAVRATGSNNKHRVLIISTYGAIHEITGFELPVDTAIDKLAVEFHCYYPQQFCFGWGNQTTWGSSSDVATVENYCKTFYPFVQKNIPVILGEFGAVYKNNESARIAYAKTVAQTSKKYGIKTIWWDNGTLSGSTTDSYGLIDRNTYDVAQQGIISALIDNSQSVIATGYPTISKITSTSTSTSTKKPTTTTTSTKPTTVTTVTTIPVFDAKFSKTTVSLSSANKAVLKWSAINGAQGYNIYKATSNGALNYYKTILGTSFTDTLKRGKTYKYRVCAYTTIGDNICECAFSKTVKVTSPAEKVSVLKKQIYKKYAKLTVQAIGMQKFEVKYSKKSNMKNAVKTTNNSSVFKIKNLKSKTKYFIKIRAYQIINSKKVYTKFKSFSFKTK